MKFACPLMAMVFVLAVGCGGTPGGSAGTTTSEGTPATAGGTTANYAGEVAQVGLAPVDGSGASGTATFTDVAEGVRVDLDVRGLPDPDAAYLAHIHPGTCADGQAGEEEGETDEEAAHADHEGTMAEIEYPLPAITPDPEGRGSTTDLLEGVTVARLFSGSPKYVNVHAAGSGNPPAIACGPLSR